MASNKIYCIDSHVMDYLGRIKHKSIIKKKNKMSKYINTLHTHSNSFSNEKCANKISCQIYKYYSQTVK